MGIDGDVDWSAVARAREVKARLDARDRPGHQHARLRAPGLPLDSEPSAETKQAARWSAAMADLRPRAEQIARSRGRR